MEITPDVYTLVTDLETDFEKAFGEGALRSTDGAVAAPAITGFLTMPEGSKEIIRKTYMLIVAALFKQLGGYTGTVPFRKPDGSAGTLTFSNGILTGVV